MGRETGREGCWVPWQWEGKGVSVVDCAATAVLRLGRWSEEQRRKESRIVWQRRAPPAPSLSWVSVEDLLCVCAAAALIISPADSLFCLWSAQTLWAAASSALNSPSCVGCSRLLQGTVVFIIILTSRPPGEALSCNLGGHEPRVYAAVCFWLCWGSGGHQLCCAGVSVSAAAGSLLCLYQRLTCSAFITLHFQTNQVRGLFYYLKI